MKVVFKSGNSGKKSGVLLVSSLKREREDITGSNTGGEKDNIEIEKANQVERELILDPPSNYK